MNRATDRMIEFAQRIAKRLGIEIEDELEEILSNGAKYEDIQEFIKQYKDERW